MRYFYKCLDCLNVCAAESERALVAECGACGGKLECMGRVNGCHISTTVHRCPCDHRCTGATGPNCECSCGGVNHGSGVLVPVEVGHGPIPRLKCHPTAKLQRIAAEWREVSGACLAALTRLRERRDVSRLPQADYNRMYQLERALAYACGLRTHSGRMAALAKYGFTVAAEPAPMWELV